MYKWNVPGDSRNTSAHSRDEFLNDM